MTPSKDNPVCVLVLGPYRSGTSVTARVLQRLGVNFGPGEEMFQGDNHNPGGFYERADINRANTRFIYSAGRNLADPGDPVELAAKGNREKLDALDLSWRRDSALWGIKDPRMCATLRAWLDLGMLDPGRTQIVLVQRDPAATTRSVMEFPHVRRYCDETPEGARAMVDRYAALAEWHAEHCGLPFFRLEYERLVATPAQTVGELGEFLGVTDRHRHRQAAGEVGKRRSLFKLWAVEYPRRAARKVLRKLRSLASGPGS